MKLPQYHEHPLTPDNADRAGGPTDVPSQSRYDHSQQVANALTQQAREAASSYAIESSFNADMSACEKGATGLAEDNWTFGEELRDCYGNILEYVRSQSELIAMGLEDFRASDVPMGIDDYVHEQGAASDIDVTQFLMLGSTPDVTREMVVTSLLQMEDVFDLCYRRPNSRSGLPGEHVANCICYTCKLDTTFEFLISDDCSNDDFEDYYDMFAHRYWRDSLRYSDGDSRSFRARGFEEFEIEASAYDPRDEGD